MKKKIIEYDCSLFLLRLPISKEAFFYFDFECFFIMHIVLINNEKMAE